jgi:chemotaxis protein methyltransferase CheR
MRAVAVETEETALEFIRSLIYERARIRMDGGKHALIKARLGKRLRHHGFCTLPEYCEFLRRAAPADEITCVIDSLTTNFTHFMREPAHFEFLINEAVARFAAAGERNLRVWSAACSSGEEPFTIAFYLAAHGQKWPNLSWSIAASDISTKVLEKARAAVFDQERVSSLPREWLPRFFQRGVGRWEGHYKVKREIRDRVTFGQVNLVQEYAQTCTYQVIFCRNVMIYFDRNTQEQLVNRLCRHLAPGGYLLVGHSESLNGFRVPLTCLRPSIYQKK